MERHSMEWRSMTKEIKNKKTKTKKLGEQHKTTNKQMKQNDQTETTGDQRYVSIQSQHARCLVDLN